MSKNINFIGALFALVVAGLLMVSPVFASTDDLPSNDPAPNPEPRASLSVLEFNMNEYTFSCRTDGLSQANARITYNWYFGDDNNVIIGSPESVISHVYANSGPYLVACEASDGVTLVRDEIDINVQTEPANTNNNQNTNGGGGGSSSTQTICYNGETLTARGSVLRNYLNQGAAFGPCSPVTNLSNNGNSNEVTPLSNDASSNQESETNFGRPGITGAVIGALNKVGVFGVIAFIVIIGIAFVGIRFLSPKAKA